ncbi:uncharacterized protein LOC109791559 isoform X1 [Cajanus cajan]|uniref:uncharacterized protein LOC109791559 isoform X1 n=1 Tax=Cajanus cajan TaxID=3821 RepID=UPI00098DC5E5|nr:uncharacterized protein LOC109791559 isoform X1 [Cajanus cajan]XP_020206452.1 uncharacterized protein LOC109791559 isoform X1 [Cajanus cajan]XP_020206453.1 uncharacterized protein LOC109791559 isoform X1 [Cajanus cajan]XP_020206455.1 uncharacterized protein LOC109791559 isoform X1 [Cajanus cajan]XP_020206456.1 uncharacterized protein LOC109791559 isoform X1 [Cajanus cajan]
MAVMEITAVAEKDAELRKSAFKPNSPACKAVVDQVVKIIEKADSKLLDQLRRYQEFYEEGEREILLTEVSSLREQFCSCFSTMEETRYRVIQIMILNLRSVFNYLKQFMNCTEGYICLLKQNVC